MVMIYVLIRTKFVHLHLHRHPSSSSPAPAYNDTLAWFSGIQFWATQVELANNDAYITSLNTMVDNVQNWTHANIGNSTTTGSLIQKAIDDTSNFFSCNSIGY